MQIEIIGRDLPGATCGPDYKNVHVGVQRQNQVIEMVLGDSQSVTWTFDCQAIERDGRLDLRGPYIHGPPGKRFIYLSWGTVTKSGDFAMFRRAKLQIGEVDAATLESAAQAGTRLVGVVSLTDEKGQPRCGSVRPPDIQWSVFGASNLRASKGPRRP